MGRTLLGIALTFWIGAAQAFEWQVRRIDGRDYSSLPAIAQFYNLPPATVSGQKSISLSSGRRSLVATLDSRDMEINGIRQVLSFPVIERDGQWWISRMDLGKTIEPALRPECVPGIEPFSTVILDPGHGGEDKGAASRYEWEKNFALDVARRVRDELRRAGLTVVMTRNTDAFVDLHDRAALANARPKSIFVSLHFNASSNRDAEGLEIFCITPRSSPSTEYDELLVRDMVREDGNASELPSFSLASAIAHSLQGSLRMADRGVKRARFAVLRLTKVPAVLVEGGFLSNPHDARLVADKNWRNAYASAIATGILAYRRLAEEKTPPPLVSDYRNPRSAPPSLPSPGPTPSGITLRDLPKEAPR